MTTAEVKMKFIDRVADGDWGLQEFPDKYGAPSMLWLLIWMFDNWNPEVADFVSNFFNPVEFYSWLEETLPELIKEWKEETFDLSKYCTIQI